MGRQGSPGLRLLTLSVFILVALAGCRGAARDDADPGKRFTSTDEARVRTLGLYSSGAKVGTYRYSRGSGLWDGRHKVFDLDESIELRLSFRGDVFTIRTRQRSYVGEGLLLLGSVSEVDFGSGSWTTTWVRTGEGRYEKTERMGKSIAEKEVKVPPGFLTTDVLFPYMEQMQKEGRKEFKADMFNLTLGQTLPVKVVYGGEKGGIRRFSVTFWGMEEEVSMDGEGMVVGETMPWGVSAAPLSDSDRIGSLSMESLFTRTGVPAANVPDDLAARGTAVFHLNGSVSMPPSTAWQSVSREDGRLTARLTRPVVPAKGSRSVDPRMSRDDFPGLDLDSKRIRELAAKITSGMNDPWEKARAVGAWVFGNLGNTMRESFSALEVLDAGEGECQSHSILAVSLIRAAGVPARFAYGVVYMPDRGLFLFHTWVEVYTGQWVPIDPTLGAFPAGVDHLTLVEGGYTDQFRVFPYIMGQGGWSVTFVAGQK